MIVFLFFTFYSVFASAQKTINVGSKIFTESFVLSEIAAQTLEESAEVRVRRRTGLGSTGVLFEALKTGEIDIYPDYSGTLAETILKRPELRSLPEIRAALEPLGLTISDSLGFNNTYALAVRESFAQKHNLRTLSDLAGLKLPWRAAFSYEFMERADGFEGLRRHYRFTFAPGQVRRMEHSLVYQAIDEDATDVIEVYSTDANIEKFGLRVLTDNLEYFPAYQALWVARLDFVKSHPEEWRRLRLLEKRIDESRMRTLNARADIDKTGFNRIAAEFLGRKAASGPSLERVLLQRTREHLWLVGISLLFSVLAGIPLGILAARYRRIGQSIVMAASVFQTIPTLALLCFLIPVFGIGIKPAVAALCLYSLLPVILNTLTGLQSIDAKHPENAKALGLSPRQILFKIMLPLASPVILTGVKTATIVSIGTATLAALVGAGGYGALIISGLSLNNMHTVLTGAVPAALLALLAHFLFEVLGALLIPKGLRKG